MSKSDDELFDQYQTAAADAVSRRRSLHGRMMALARWSKEDPAENAARGQRGLRAKFDRQTDETFPGLRERDPAEFARRSDCLYKFHMTFLAVKSANARLHRLRKQAGAE